MPYSIEIARSPTTNGVVSPVRSIVPGCWVAEGRLWCDGWEVAKAGQGTSVVTAHHSPPHGHARVGHQHALDMQAVALQ